MLACCRVAMCRQAACTRCLHACGPPSGNKRVRRCGHACHACGWSHDVCRPGLVGVLQRLRLRLTLADGSMLPLPTFHLTS